MSNTSSTSSTCSPGIRSRIGRGAAGCTTFMGAYPAAGADARIAGDGSVGERDVVASRWTMTGTHRGDFQCVPPTGRQVTMAGIDQSRVVDGKVAEHWAQFDVIG